MLTKFSLLYITNGYPYSEKDIFSGDDLAFLKKENFLLYVFPRLASSSLLTKRYEFDFKVDTSLLSNKIEKSLSLLNCDTISLFTKEFDSAAYNIIKLYYPLFFKWVGTALYEKKALKAFILGNNLHNSPIVIYTFWFSSAVIAAYLLKRDFPHIRVVSRLHGGDLYPCQSPNGYLPFRFLRADMADVLAPCSQQGADFLRSDGTPVDKIVTSYLGVPSVDQPTHPSPQGHFHICSCAFLDPVKRIPVLARALTNVACNNPDVQFVWHHVGDGPDMQSVRDALVNLPTNFEAFLHGDMIVEESRRFFLGESSDGLDALISVSSSEGLPVSMMEAQMAGLPVIATDVGGVAEIVRPDTGMLLRPDFSQSEFESAVMDLQNWKSAEIRNHIANRAAECFSLNNYKKFIDEVLWPQLYISEQILNAKNFAME